MSEDNVSLPDFNDSEQATSQLSIEQSCSELHGMICGFLCAGSQLDEKVFLKKLLENTKSANEKAIGLLAELYKVTKSQLNSMSFDFALLLPDDYAPLGERAQHLANWCAGYSEGLMDAGIEIEKVNQQESRDALLHISEIASLDFDELSVEEEDEKAFFEISEYVRMAVLMIYTELHQTNKVVTPEKKHLH